MTTFVKRLAEPYLEYMNRSLIDYGHPYGLMALILVAVRPLFLGPFRLSNNTS